MENCQLEEFRALTDEIFQKSEELTSDFSKFIDCIFKDNKKLFDERDKIKEFYGFGEYDDFNILTVTNFGWSETAHSEVLCKILDPNTPVIGSRKNLVEFFNLIGLTEEEISKWDFATIGVMTEGTENKLYDWFTLDNSSENAGKETGRIDILIADSKKNCVIIENKLKNAPNMPNQLERYVRIVQNHGLKIHKIVYMPPTKYKTPDTCDKEYEKENKEIRDNKWLVQIPAVRSMDEKEVKSLVQDYFPPLMKEELSETNKTKLVFFDQYQKLIAKLGEDEVMENIEKEIVNLLCDTPEHQKKTNDLMELLTDTNRFCSLKLKLAYENLKDTNKLIFDSFGKYVPGDYCKKLKYAGNTTSDIYIIFYKDYYGVITNDLKNKNLHADLEKRISTVSLWDGFYPTNDNLWHGLWLNKNFINTSISEIADDIQKSFDEIQQALLK